MDNRFFPLFIPTKDKKVVVFGGGNIGARRVETLLKFDFEVILVSRSLSPKILELRENSSLEIVQVDLETIDIEKFLEAAFLVVAATNNRDINKRIGEISKEHNILVSVCDAKEECDFFFPAVAVNDKLTMGLVGDGNSHHETSKAAKRLRKIIEDKDY